MIRLVLFDIDGTLIRTGGAGVQAFAHVFQNVFNATDGFENLKFAGRTDYSLIREFFAVHRIPAHPENFRRFFDAYVVELEHRMRLSRTEICAGMIEFIGELKAMRPTPVLGLLTGNIRRGAEIKLRHMNLWHEFVTGGFADDHEDRDQIAAAAKRRSEELIGEKLAGEEVLVIGDTPLDIRCARAIGAKVLAVATGGHPLRELIEHRADWAVRDVRDITAARVCA